MKEKSKSHIKEKKVYYFEFIMFFFFFFISLFHLFQILNFSLFSPFIFPCSPSLHPPSFPQSSPFSFPSHSLSLLQVFPLTFSLPVTSLRARSLALLTPRQGEKERKDNREGKVREGREEGGEK